MNERPRRARRAHLRAMDSILRSLELLRDTVPDWKRYPFCIPTVAKLERLELHPEVTILIGENGSGKSTLVEAIAIKAGFNPEGGTKNFVSSHRPSESLLHEHLRLVRGIRREKGGFFMRAETMFNIATEAEAYGSYGWERLHEKSHGEAFLWTLKHRFHDGGLFILDEPESALSPQRQLSLLGRMRQLVRGGSQFVIATHSPILMAYPGARLLLLDAAGMREVRYEETEHYAVTKVFLQDPARMLRELFTAMDAQEDAAREG